MISYLDLAKIGVFGEAVGSEPEEGFSDGFWREVAGTRRDGAIHWDAKNMQFRSRVFAIAAEPTGGSIPTWIFVCHSIFLSFQLEGNHTPKFID